MALQLSYTTQLGLAVDNAYWTVKLSMDEDFHKGILLHFTSYVSRESKLRGYIERYIIRIPTDSWYYTNMLTDDCIAAAGGRPRQIAYRLAATLDGKQDSSDPFYPLAGIDFTLATDVLDQEM